MRLLTFGAGNMACALIPLMARTFSLDVIAYTPSQTRAESLAREVDGEVLRSLDSIPKADLYFLSCKPQQVRELARDVGGKLDSKGIIISLLAGTTIQKIEELFNHHKIIRVMPNTPCLIGSGVSLIKGQNISTEDLSKVRNLLESAGSVFEMSSEDQLDRLTGYTGSGPAYLFEWARIFIEDLKDKGITESQAREMIVDLFYGASKMMRESELSPELLRNNVTSKKGVTFEALEVFKKEGLESMTTRALEAAYKRSKELSK